jgi:uncharacterized membrane protein required for colicin V production
MVIKHRILALLFGIVIFTLIIELIRRRKLREEYSWLWLLAGAIILLPAAWDNLLFLITRLLSPTSPGFVLLFLGFFFMLLINIQVSVKLSTLSNQVKNIAQKTAFLENELERLLNDSSEKAGEKRDG